MLTSRRELQRWGMAGVKSVKIDLELSSAGLSRPLPPCCGLIDNLR
jgi:hypothetical protein